MNTRETTKPHTKTRFFQNPFRGNEQKEAPKSVTTQATTALIAKARNIYDEIPESLTDTLVSFELLEEVVLTKHGQVYEKQSLIQCLKIKPECPRTREALQLSDIENPCPDDKAIQDHLNSVIQDYKTVRATFLSSITEGTVTDEDISAYQTATAQTLNDFEQAKQSMFESGIEENLKIRYRQAHFPQTVESYDTFCSQVLVLSDYNEWVQKSCATTYTEYPFITAALWNLNNKLIKLYTSIETEPSYQLVGIISQLKEEHQHVLDHMERIKLQRVPSRKDPEHSGTSFLFPDEDPSFLRHSTINLETWGIEGIFLAPDEILNPESDAKKTPRDQASNDEKREAVPPQSSQSFQCSCSLFLKMVSAVALTSGIVLLIVLHASVGLAPGIISLCVGGLTLFAATREKKPDPPPSNAPAVTYNIS